MPEYIHSDRGSGFMSKDLKNYLHSRGIATSRTTPYNPRGNGQVERYNGVVWRGISLRLASQGLDEHHWLSALPDVLHSMRSLVCTTTNQTPHERLFNYTRKSTCGSSLPSWLLSPGPVLVRRYVRKSKYDPMVDEVMLLEANPKYAHIRLNDGTEKTVSLRDLAPTGQPDLSTNFSQYDSFEPDIVDSPEISTDNQSIRINAEQDSVQPIHQSVDAEYDIIDQSVDSEHGIIADEIDISEPTAICTRESSILTQPENELVYDYISKSGRISRKPDRLGINN